MSELYADLKFAAFPFSVLYPLDIMECLCDKLPTLNTRANCSAPMTSLEAVRCVLNNCPLAQVPATEKSR